MMTEVDNDYYIDHNAAVCDYYFNNRTEIRMPTLEEIEEFITTFTLDSLKKYVIFL